MLIIWGWRGITRSGDTGVFYCPHRGDDRGYSEKRVRRWFTLFFIPVLPLNHLGDYVECAHCESTYDRAVLDLQTVAQMRSTAEDALRRVLVGVARADGILTSEEADYSIELGCLLIGEAYGPEDVAADARAFKDEALIPALKAFVGVTNEHGKVMVLKAATLLAARDGEIHGSEIELIRNMAEALDVPRSYLPGIMNDALGSLTETRMVERG